MEGGGAWRAAVPGVTKSQTQVSDLTTATQVNQQLLRLGIHTVKKNNNNSKSKAWWQMGSEGDRIVSTNARVLVEMASI